ncbi:MAG: winged helix-turn-helix domain-containing protein [Caldilineaceae bacterium]|jgi:DNA-binding response OmpR family regulator
MSQQRILIVDDELPVQEVLSLYLQREGFLVQTAGDGEAALIAVQTDPPDLVVLDLMLPKVSGMEVFRYLRAESNIPVIMLTAKSDEVDRVVGLELGADDYVVKPFSPREVAARVKNVLRRAAPPPPQDDAHPIIHHADLSINPLTYGVEINGERVALTSTEFELLYFLARHPGQVFNRDQLLEQVWGYEFPADDSTVTVHIHRLREKIEPDPSDPIYILTVWGVGYRFAERG